MIAPEPERPRMRLMVVGLALNEPTALQGKDIRAANPVPTEPRINLDSRISNRSASVPKFESKSNETASESPDKGTSDRTEASCEDEGSHI